MKGVKRRKRKCIQDNIGLPNTTSILRKNLFLSINTIKGAELHVLRKQLRVEINSHESHTLETGSFNNMWIHTLNTKMNSRNSKGSITRFLQKFGLALVLFIYTFR